MYTSNFDSDSQLKTHRVGSDTRTLTYDAASRITQTTDTNPAYNRTYDYDELDRQQNIAGPVTKTYSFDAVGNPLSDKEWDQV